MPCFFLGIAKRKGIVLGEPEWLALAEATPDSRGPLTDFYKTAMKIPLLLEQTDEVLAAQQPHLGLDTLCAK